MPELIEEPGAERQEDERFFAVDFLKKTFKFLSLKFFGSYLGVIEN
jgi:hypothetical protein